MKKILCFISIIFFSLSLYADWPMYRGNHYLTGNNDEIVPNSNSLNWSFTGSSYLFYPIPHKDLVFVACLDKHIYAINKVTGEIKWKIKLDAAAFKSMAAYKDYLLVTAGDYLYVINIKNGTILWSRKEGISIQLSTPIVVDDIVYYGSRKFFYSRYVHNGHELWKNDQLDIYGGTPIYWNHKIYFLSKDFSRKRSILTCLDTQTGKSLWQQDMPSDPNIFTPVVFNGKVYISILNKIYCYDAVTGEIVWEKMYSSNIGSVLVYANSTLYTSFSDGDIYRVDPDNGQIIDSFGNYNQQGADFILIGETLYIPNAEGVLYAFNGSSKQLKWKFQAPHKDKKGYLSAEDGRVYMAMENKLYSISKGILPSPYEMIAAASISPEPFEQPAAQPQTQPQSQPEPQPKPEQIKPPQKEMEQIEVSMTDPDNKPLDGIITLQQNDQVSDYQVRKGKATLNVEKNKDFTVIANAPNHFVKSINIQAEEQKKKVDIQLERIEMDKTYAFQNIEFAYNSAELTYGSFPTLEAIAKLLKANPHLKIEIGGHTDSVGGDTFNQLLSQRRANKVREFLIKKGVPDSFIDAKGYGEKKPVDSNDTETGRAKNRRTEFKILKK